MRERKISYEEMLYMPRPVSKKHPPMDRKNRAAQFSPFAALTGYEEAVHRKQEEVKEHLIRTKGLE